MRAELLRAGEVPFLLLSWANMVACNTFSTARTLYASRGVSAMSWHFFVLGIVQIKFIEGKKMFQNISRQDASSIVYWHTWHVGSTFRYSRRYGYKLHKRRTL